MASGSHKLHMLVKMIVESSLPEGCEARFDSACNEKESDSFKQHLPLFNSDIKANENVFCNVDILILKNGMISVIMEIEESGILPTKICGKFLTSALSSEHIHDLDDNEPVKFSDNILFIQVLCHTNTSQEEKSKLRQKWGNLEESINAILPLKGSSVKKYRLLYGRLDDFAGEKGKELRNAVRNHLR